MSIEEPTAQQSQKRHPSEDKPWLFKPGQSGNPSGRPKGSKSLKTYAKEYLETLNDAEKLEFMKGLPKDVIWKMAEGNPKQDSEMDVTLKGPSVVRIDE